MAATIPPSSYTLPQPDVLLPHQEKGLFLQPLWIWVGPLTALTTKLWQKTLLLTDSFYFLPFGSWLSEKKCDYPETTTCRGSAGWDKEERTDCERERCRAVPSHETLVWRNCCHIKKRYLSRGTFPWIPGPQSHKQNNIPICSRPLCFHVVT